MKTLTKLLGLLVVATMVFAACSKDDDPADNDLFVGTYNGRVSYSGDGSNISERDGSVRVVKAGGDNYNFMFSDNIPNLMDITMRKGDNTHLIFGEDGTAAYIRITASELRIAFTRDGETWTANANR